MVLISGPCASRSSPAGEYGRKKKNVLETVCGTLDIEVKLPEAAQTLWALLNSASNLLGDCLQVTLPLTFSHLSGGNKEPKCSVVVNITQNKE